MSAFNEPPAAEALEAAAADADAALRLPMLLLAALLADVAVAICRPTPSSELAMPVSSAVESSPSCWAGAPKPRLLRLLLLLLLSPLPPPPLPRPAAPPGRPPIGVLAALALQGEPRIGR